MLFATPTRYGGGLTVWGDYYDLKGAHSVISYFFDKSSVTYRVKEYSLALAYDLRHAYQGDRATKDFGIDPSENVKYRGVSILWPFFLSQLAIVRHQASFTPHTQYQQAFLYLLDNCARSALEAADPLVAKECINWLECPPRFGEDYLVEYFYQCTKEYVFTGRPGKQRLRRLPQILRSMHPLSEKYLRFSAILKRKADELKCSVHELSDHSDWPEYKV